MCFNSMMKDRLRTSDDAEQALESSLNSTVILRNCFQSEPYRLTTDPKPKLRVIYRIRIPHDLSGSCGALSDCVRGGEAQSRL